VDWRRWHILLRVTRPVTRGPEAPVVERVMLSDLPYLMEHHWMARGLQPRGTALVWLTWDAVSGLTVERCTSTPHTDARSSPGDWLLKVPVVRAAMAEIERAIEIMAQPRPAEVLGGKEG
jgi:hypothetical protein